MRYQRKGIFSVFGERLALPQIMASWLFESMVRSLPYCTPARRHGLVVTHDSEPGAMNHPHNILNQPWKP
jgi:hypothetical protein